MSIVLANCIEIDNKIIFNLEKFIKDIRYRCIPPNTIKNSYKITNDCRVFYNDYYNQDLISKLYLFECLFNANHTNTDIKKELKVIVNRVGLKSGRQLQHSPQQECLRDKFELQVINNVIMEKFMGNQPFKIYVKHCNDDNVNIEIFQSTPSNQKQQHENCEFYQTINDKCLTQRFINRTNLILKTINQQKIIKDTYELPRIIREDENLQGYDKTVCRKSVFSIIQRLIEEGYIKAYKVIINNEKQSKGQTFICKMNVNYDDPVITTTIDEIKMKFHIITTKTNQQSTIQVRKQKQSPFSFYDVKSSINELKQLTTSRLEIMYKYNKNAGYNYGYSPKFVRMRLLHEFLFYLIYEQNQQIQQLNQSEIYELCNNYKIKLRKNDLNDLPSVYCKEIGWKMFVPSLPNHQNWPIGWALVCDIILRIPLSLFVKLYNVCYNIPELDDLLNHPIKRHFLLKHIDNNIKNVLLLKRKYLHHIYDTISNLCHIGLIQLGPKSSKEKDQIFIYLNRKASLLDTTTSQPGYNQIENKQYKKLCFEFKTVNNVEFYWSEMWRICLNTRLGKRKIMEGQFVTIEDCLIKQQMIETLKQQTLESVLMNDNGQIPGDHKGAAGLDSSLWSYVKRNWSWNLQLKPKQLLLQQQQQQEIDSLNNDKLQTNLPKPIQYDLLNTKNVQQKVYLTPKTKQNKQIKGNYMNKLITKKCKILRKIPPLKKRIREYYDNIDKAIMKQNRQTRVEWDDVEDFYLRFLRAAALFLCPIAKRQMITYTIMRDVLHRIYPKSHNKTSKAIQRRMCFLQVTDEILRIMETNVENFLNSSILAKYFGQIHNRYQIGRKYTDAQITIAFIYFISYIKKHSKEIELLLLGYIATVDFFSHPYIALFELILDNIENNDRIYQQPQTINDIKIDTIKTIIHCSINCKLNPNFGYQLFQIYREYSDELIKNSINQLKQHQFLTLNKRQNEKNFTANWHIPLKFSYLFTTMKTTTTYNLVLYHEIYEKFRLLLTNSNEFNFLTINELNTIWQQFRFNFDIPEHGIILNPAIDDHTDIIDEISKRFYMYLKKINDDKGEINQNNTEITIDNNPNNTNFHIDDIKNRVIKLIFRVPYLIEGNLEDYLKKLKDSQSNLEINNYLYLMVIDLKRFALDNCLSMKLKEFINQINDDETIINNPMMLLMNLSKTVYAIQNLCIDDDDDNVDQKFHQWETDEELNFNDDNINNSNKITEKRKLQLTNKSLNNTLDACIKNALNGQIPTIKDIKIGIIEDLDNENRKIPHITDLTQFLIKEKLESYDDDENIEQLKEHFIIKYPNLINFEIEHLNEFQNQSNIKELIQHNGKMKINKYLHDLNIIQLPQLEKIIEYVRNLNGNYDDIDYVKNLINFIANKKQFGVTCVELKRNFLNKSTLCLIKLLNFLCNIHVILHTGIRQICYVHYDYQNDWLVKTFMMPPDEQQIDVESLKIDMKKKIKSSDILQAKFTPWSKLDGTINETLLQEWLCLILSKCFDYPNMTFTRLCEHFCFIKPVDLFFLLEILQEIKSIEIYVYDQIENNIFSSRTEITDKPATCLDNFDDMYIKTKGLSGLYFGSFIYNNAESVAF